MFKGVNDDLICFEMVEVKTPPLLLNSPTWYCRRIPKQPPSISKFEFHPIQTKKHLSKLIGNRFNQLHNYAKAWNVRESKSERIQRCFIHFSVEKSNSFLPRNNRAPTQRFCRMLLISTYQEIGPSHKRPWTIKMRLTIVFVIAFIVTCISDTLGSCRQKFTELVTRLQVRPRPRQLLHYDIASIYTHQKHPLSLKSKKLTKNNSRRPKKMKKSKVLPTDRRTDGPTDGPTDGAGCRVACTRLKTVALALIYISGFIFIYFILKTIKKSLGKLAVSAKVIGVL